MGELWQIRDADGNEIAARIWARVSEASSLPSVVRGLKDGFLIGGQLGGGLPQVTRLSADGASSTPRVVRGVTTTKPGDVQLYRGDLEWFYRPADDTVRRFAPPVAFPARQQVLLTDKGTPVETSLTKRGLFLHTSADGGTTWKRTPVPTIKGAAASRIFVGGGFIWAGLTTISDEGYDVLHFLVRTSETKPGAWERTDLRAHAGRLGSCGGEGPNAVLPDFVQPPLCVCAGRRCCGGEVISSLCAIFRARRGKSHTHGVGN